MPDFFFYFHTISVYHYYMNRSRFFLSLIVSYLVIAAIAFVSASLLAHRVDRTQRELLLVQAKQASLLIHDDAIASLSASKADISNPLYQHLKHTLTQFREANPDIRFVYVMGYHPEIKTQFFYVDSEPEASVDYSPPGQLFPDTRPEDIERYLKGEPYTDGPYEDSWGEWVSGYVPVFNEQGAVAYMIGIDIATDVWHTQIGFARTMIAIIAILFAILAAFVFRAIYRKEETLATMTLKNQKLEKTQSTYKQLQSMAHLGSVVFHFIDHIAVLDEQFRELVPGNNEGRVPIASFVEAAHPDDRERLNAMIKEVTSSDILYAWVDVRFGTKEEGFRKFHLYGNVKRKPSGGAERFDGIMQDITDLAQ